MRKILKTLLCTAAVATLAMIGSAQAALLGAGSVSMAGGWTPSGGTGTIATATGVHFVPPTNNVTITAPGGAGALSSLTPRTLRTAHEFRLHPPHTPGIGLLQIRGLHL